jgi:hypothetical protein
LNTYSSITLLLVVILTSTTFTSLVIVVSQQQVEPLLLPQISHETSVACQQTLNNLSFYVHSNHTCGMHMEMFSVVFDLVMMPMWFPLWSILFFFYMSPHCDLSSHSLCNVCQSSLYYSIFSLVLPIWYFVVLKVYSLFL